MTKSTPRRVVAAVKSSLRSSALQSCEAFAIARVARRQVADIGRRLAPSSDLAEDGGTDYVLYRKDRVRCIRGGDLLEDRRLKPDLPTNRMYARCCDTAMFVDFTKGHWLTVYRSRLPKDIPPATMRVMTAARPEGVVLPEDMANYPGHSGKFMMKLLRAWMAMGFRRPAVDGVP